MRSCRTIKFLFNLVPLKRWQYFLLQHHYLRCPECKKDLIGIEEAQLVTFSKEKMKIGETFWQELEQRLKKGEKEKKPSLRFGWKWAAGTSLLLAAALVIVFKSTPLFEGKGPDLAAKLKINYIELYEEPAQAFIFQTQDADRTFIWVEKRIKGETQ